MTNSLPTLAVIVTWEGEWVAAPMQRARAWEMIVTEPPEETLTTTMLFFHYQMDVVHVFFTVHWVRITLSNFTPSHILLPIERVLLGLWWWYLVYVICVLCICCVSVCTVRHLLQVTCMIPPNSTVSCGKFPRLPVRVDADRLCPFRVLPAQIPQKALYSRERRISHTYNKKMHI